MTGLFPKITRQAMEGKKLWLSPRFVGLVFHTLPPNLAESLAAIKFVNGNIGLAMEIGNQGSILGTLIKMSCCSSSA
jgi:Ca2+/H+ antiporter